MLPSSRVTRETYLVVALVFVTCLFVADISMQRGITSVRQWGSNAHLHLADDPALEELLRDGYDLANTTRSTLLRQIRALHEQVKSLKVGCLATAGKTAAEKPLNQDGKRVVVVNSDAAKDNLYVFIGDSLDRFLVQEQCQRLGVTPEHPYAACKKCISCVSEDGRTKFANVMTLGTGLNDKWHKSTWEDDVLRLPRERISAYLMPLLEDSDQYKRVMISVNIYLWDWMAEDPIRFIDGSYGEQVYGILQHTKRLTNSIPHAAVVWRTAPYNKKSIEGTHRVNSITRMACCAARVPIVDWERVTSTPTDGPNGLVLKDDVHYESYQPFWEMYQPNQLSAPIGQSPCGPVLTSHFDTTQAIKEDGALWCLESPPPFSLRCAKAVATAFIDVEIVDGAPILSLFGWSLGGWGTLVAVCGVAVGALAIGCRVAVCPGWQVAAVPQPLYR